MKKTLHRPIGIKKRVCQNNDTPSCNHRLRITVIEPNADLGKDGGRWVNCSCGEKRDS